MLSLVPALLLCLPSLCIAATPAQLPAKTLFAPPDISAAFRLQGTSALGAAAKPYTITLHLVGQDEDGLAAWLDANSGKNILTPEQLARYITPPQANIDAVTTFLTKKGGVDPSAIKASTYKNTLTVQTTVAKTAAMFNAHFNDYRVANTTKIAPRTLQYSIPGDIAHAVEMVSPLASFVPPAGSDGLVRLPKKTVTTSAAPGVKSRRLARRAAGDYSNCNNDLVTPTCLRQYYGTYDYVPVAHPVQNDIFVSGELGMSFSQSDLTLFLKTLRPEAAGATVQVLDVAGAVNDGSNPGTEAMLDTCTIVGATWPLKTVYHNYGTAYSDGDVYQKSFQDVVDNYVAYGRPGVYSLSWAYLESRFTKQEAKLLCKTAMHLSALGTTVVVSTGDWGIGGMGQYTAASDPVCPPFQPLYPAGCPYLLTVGATQSFAPERMLDPTTYFNLSSGAGFSNYFDRPSYQDKAVTAWMKSPSAKGAKGLYNTKGRAYPDLSAQGSQYAVGYYNFISYTGGTSASTPTVASIVALVNSERRLRGMPNVGWVNPTLYNGPIRMTKDITNGNVTGCTGKGAQYLGFNTAVGWDAASGWGTPLFDNFRAAFGVAA